MARAQRRSPLNDYLSATRGVETALRRELTAAAGKGQRAVEQAVKRGIAQDKGILYRSVRSTNRELWVTIGEITKRGMTNVSYAGTKDAVAIDELLGVKGRDKETRKQAQIAADHVISRRINGYNLSGRVYRSGVRANGILNGIIDQSIREQASAKELAERVRDSIRPDVPGGVSYSAQRLARTELNNAFHTSQIRSYEDRDYVMGVKWHLSESHPRKDECNEYSEQDDYELGRGVFEKGKIPSKPHPQCFCYLTAVIDENYLATL